MKAKGLEKERERERGREEKHVEYGRELLQGK